MTAPARIQLSRRPGWRKPAGAVVVSRPSKWGNPYKLGEGKTPAALVASYRGLLLSGKWLVTPADVRRELAGKVLACWCPLGAPCHADVLLEIANEGGPE